MQKWLGRSLFLALVFTASSLLTFGCASESTSDDNTDNSTIFDGKTDSGWLGSDTFEVNAVVRAIARQAPSDEWADLETDHELQVQLVDNQIKFIKNTAEALDWRFNQLADQVTIVSTEIDTNGDVVIEYEAIVDMLGRIPVEGVPPLDDLEPRIFTAEVPVDPVGFSYTTIQNCTVTDNGYSAADYNFHYYFAPDAPDCSMELIVAEIEITEVFPRDTVYPEYDQLMQPMVDGTVGFRAALVPNRGDTDPLSRFNTHADMLELQLGLEGVDATDGNYRRYTWQRGGVTMVIDLYDPTDLPWTTDFAESFRDKLSEYDLVHYNGHSAYGTKHLLDQPNSYSDDYQIIIVHSCQSYAYYTRQVFRAKATDEDPSGFALADVVATGMSSYPTGSPRTLRVILEGLMIGMEAIDNDRPENAPDWLMIAEAMSGITWGDIMYGVAGVRTNAWTPAP